MLVPWVADWCLIEVTGEPAAGLAAHADPSMSALVEELAGTDDGDRAASRVARTAVAELAVEATADSLVAPDDAARRAALEKLGVR